MSTVFVAARGRCIVPEPMYVSSGPAVRLRHVLRDSDAAVVGRIHEIGPSIRNYSCAMHHVIGEGDEHVTLPTRYTAVRIAVDEVLFFDPTYPELKPPPLERGETLVWYLRDPTDGVSLRFDSVTVESMALHAGERRLFFLSYRNLLYVDQAGPPVWRGAVGGFTWAIRNDDVAFPSLRSVREDLASKRLPQLTRVQIEVGTQGVPLSDLREYLRNIHE